MSIARERLTAERKKFRQNHPPGFYARPTKNEDGSINMMMWECGIPGQKGSLWDIPGAIYPLTMTFPPEYPAKPPKCAFPKGFYHPNIYNSGTVCLSILNEDKDWRVAIGIETILLGIQDLLANPNEADPAQAAALNDFTKNIDEYNRKVKEQAQKYKQID